LHSGLRLAEYLHDQGKDSSAAEVYQKLLDLIGPKGFGVNAASEGYRHSLARMNYFLACHWAQEHDEAKELLHLERAFQADPKEVDTLIACSRIPSAPPQFRGRVAKSIEKETVALREKVAQDPTSAQNYNEFAWLAGNTKGDLDEALRASQRSLELSPNHSAYLDTLAHVYFAKGDLASAVKYQTMALEREPHSGLMISELKRFRAALEEKGKK
jgi:tetratricopeptide (TPR) repeat protein